MNVYIYANTYICKPNKCIAIIKNEVINLRVRGHMEGIQERVSGRSGMTEWRNRYNSISIKVYKHIDPVCLLETKYDLVVKCGNKR